MSRFDLAVAFPDLAAMVASGGVSAPPRVDGGVYWVRSEGQWAEYKAASTASVVEGEVLLPADEVGRWHLGKGGVPGPPGEGAESIAGGSADPTAAPPTIDPAINGAAQLYVQTGATPFLYVGLDSTGAVGYNGWGRVAIDIGGGGGGEPSAGLLFWYKFDNNLDDSSGNGLTLTKQGDGEVTYVASDLGNAATNFYFSDPVSGVDTNYAFTASSSELDTLENGFYMAFVVTRKEPFFAVNLVAQNYAAGPETSKFYLRMDEGSSFDDPNDYVMNFRLQAGSFPNVFLGIPNDADESFLVEIFYNPATSEAGIAINNSPFEKITDAPSLPVGNTPLWIGGERDGDVGGPVWRAWEGSIDLAACWSAPFADLSPTGPERAALWNGGDFRSDP